MYQLESYTDKEPYGFDATEQISLTRSIFAALAVSLLFLRKQDNDMYHSVYGSGLLADCYFSCLLILAFDGFKALCLNPLLLSTQMLFIRGSNTHAPILSFQGRCKHLGPFQSTSIICPITTHINQIPITVCIAPTYASATPEAPATSPASAPLPRHL